MGRKSPRTVVARLALAVPGLELATIPMTGTGMGLRFQQNNNPGSALTILPRSPILRPLLRQLLCRPPQL
jgi:hypothetical protein